MKKILVSMVLAVVFFTGCKHAVEKDTETTSTETTSQTQTDVYEKGLSMCSKALQDAYKGVGRFTDADTGFVYENRNAFDHYGNETTVEASEWKKYIIENLDGGNDWEIMVLMGNDEKYVEVFKEVNGSVMAWQFPADEFMVISGDKRVMGKDGNEEFIGTLKYADGTLTIEKKVKETSKTNYQKEKKSFDAAGVIAWSDYKQKSDLEISHH